MQMPQTVRRDRGLFRHFTSNAQRFVRAGGQQAKRELTDVLEQGRGVETSGDFDIPAVDTGEYINSIREFTVRENGEWVSRTGVATEFAIPLEFGSEDTRPRPAVTRLSSERPRRSRIAVSYTHLTLPTICSV